MGGETENPTYEEVSMGNTGHVEVVEIEFDPNIITYSELLEVFWRNIDPTALNYQFADVGSQYRTEIFTVGSQQMEEALQSKTDLENSGKFDKTEDKISEIINNKEKFKNHYAEITGFLYHSNQYFRKKSSRHLFFNL